jgi:hypothetical protein
MNLQHEPFSRRATVLALATAHYASLIFPHPPSTHGHGVITKLSHVYGALWYIPVHGCLYWGEWVTERTDSPRIRHAGDLSSSITGKRSIRPPIPPSPAS